MAKILDFVRRTRCARAARTAPRSTRLLEDFSIEVMPRTAAKIDDFRAILPAGTRVYLAHIDGTDFAEMLATARRLADEGFAVMPHFPARGIATRAELEIAHRRLRRRRRPPRRWSSPAASTRPRGAYAEAMQLLRTGLFDAHGFTDLHVAGHPEGNRDIDPAGGDAVAWPRSPPRPPSSARPTPRMAIATQFCFEAAPVDRLGRPAARGRHHPAGPHRRRRPGQAADHAQVRHGLRRRPVAARAAAPRRRPEQADAAVRADRVPRRARRATRRRNPDFPVERVHFFPLGGIAATTDYAGAMPRPAAARAGMTRSRCSSTSTARSSTPTTCTTRAFATILAERGRDLSARRVPHPHHGPARTTRSSRRFFPGEDMAVLDRKEAMFRDSLAASVEPVAGIHALLDWAEANGAGCAVVTNAPRDNAVAMLAAAEPRPPAADRGHRRRVRAPEARPRALPRRRCAALGATPVALGRLRGLPLRPARRPRRPAPTSSA